DHGTPPCWRRYSMPQGGQIRLPQRRLVGNGALANLPTMQRDLAPLPTLIWGILSQAPGSAGCEGEALAQRRRAEPSGAQRVAVDMHQDWLPEIAAAHCITSYPVGSS